jgi:hypothetical protein
VSNYDASILTETKKALGIEELVTVFDTELCMHITSVLGTLNQLGVGPESGLEVSDATTPWADLLLMDLKLSPVRSYVLLRVKMIFDPPQSSWHVVAMKEQIEQLEWRINAAREDQIVTEEVIDEDDDVFWYRYFRYLDGGSV